MKVHRFTAKGLLRFGHYLDALEADSTLPVPMELLTEPDCVSPVNTGASIEIELKDFGSRMEAGRYLDAVLSTTEGINVPRDVGLWAWLTLFYFEQVCPQDADGHRKMKARSTYVPLVDERRRFYRHALLGPYLAYRAHRDEPGRASVLLSEPLSVTTSEAYRLFIETELLNMRSPVELANRFYFNQNTGRLRKGKGTKGPGGIRRFVAVLQQFDLTYDIHELTSDELLALIPAEFAKWRAGR